MRPPEPEGLVKLRAMAALGGTAEGVRTRRSSAHTGPSKIVAAFWAPYGLDNTVWTWTPSEGLVEHSSPALKAWRPAYEPYLFHTDEEWKRIDEITPHPNQHVFDRVAKSANFMADAPNPLRLLSSARNSR